MSYIEIIMLLLLIIFLITTLILFFMLLSGRQERKILIKENNKLKDDNIVLQINVDNNKKWEKTAEENIAKVFELEYQIEKIKNEQVIAAENGQSLLHINNLVIDKTQELKDLEQRCELMKEDINGKTTSLEGLKIQIENINKQLQLKQAAWNAVDSFEKCKFGDELPYIDYEEYFSKNNFEIVLKLLDDCIEVAPQFKSELRKIEWNLCYLPYKKTFIKDFSRSGIYMLEVKSKYENEVLKELGLKRINDNGSIVYIGQAINIYDRWTTHIKKMLGIEVAGGEKIYKFKPLMFKWKIIEWCDSSELDSREKFWIDSFKSDEFGLNSKGGNKKD